MVLAEVLEARQQHTISLLTAPVVLFMATHQIATILHQGALRHRQNVYRLRARFLIPAHTHLY